MTNFGSAIQLLNPATIGVLGMFVIVGLVAAVTRHYRYKLPKCLQKSWKLHHGAYKLAGVAAIIVAIVFSTGADKYRRTKAYLHRLSYLLQWTTD